VLESNVFKGLGQVPAIKNQRLTTTLASSSTIKPLDLDQMFHKQKLNIHHLQTQQYFAKFTISITISYITCQFLTMSVVKKNKNKK
jgi:hypothetical protein